MVYTTPVQISSIQIIIRCQALSIDDICYFTKYQSNEKDQINEEETITRLNIGGNDIGPNGIQNLANALAKNTTLTTLDLQDNHIGDEEMQYLCDALRKTVVNFFFLLISSTYYLDNFHMQTLTTLDLSSNLIGASGVQYLADVLDNNS
ncbi:unnamed protein product, partial [Rotaria sp. Silwood2]